MLFEDSNRSDVVGAIFCLILSPKHLKHVVMASDIFFVWLP